MPAAIALVLACCDGFWVLVLAGVALAIMTAVGLTGAVLWIIINVWKAAVEAAAAKGLKW